MVEITTVAVTTITGLKEFTNSHYWFLLGEHKKKQRVWRKPSPQGGACNRFDLQSRKCRLLPAPNYDSLSFFLAGNIEAYYVHN